VFLGIRRWLRGDTVVMRPEGADRIEQMYESRPSRHEVHEQIPVHDPPQSRIPWSLSQDRSTDEDRVARDEAPVLSKDAGVEAMLWEQSLYVAICVNEDTIAVDDVGGHPLSILDEHGE
jgi:hypothetical protein